MQQEDQYRTIQPQFKNEPQSSITSHNNYKQQNDNQNLRMTGNSNYQTFNIKLNKVNQPTDSAHFVKGFNLPPEVSQSELVGVQIQSAHIFSQGNTTEGRRVKIESKLMKSYSNIEPEVLAK